MSIVVVSGLASGVGKTTAVAAIMRVLQRRGHEVVPVKVARLEHTPAPLDISTIERLTGTAGVDFSEKEDPIAAVRELADTGVTVVVEGSGGLSVPLVGDQTIADIAADLNAPLVVVSGMAPGAVSLAVQAVRFARACGARVEGVIGGKLPTDADLVTRLMLMKVSNATNVPFLGSIYEGVGNLSAEEFAKTTTTIMLPPGW